MCIACRRQIRVCLSLSLFLVLFHSHSLLPVTFTSRTCDHQAQAQAIFETRRFHTSRLHVLLCFVFGRTGLLFCRFNAFGKYLSEYGI